MTRPIRIAVIPGHDAALAAALVAMTGPAAQAIDVVEIVAREPDPLPQLQVFADPMRPPASHGPKRTRKGKPARW